MRGLVVILVAGLAGCGAETSQPWDLVHDRIIAVRASAPSIAAGEAATLDVLVTTEADGPMVLPPARVELAPDEPPGVVTIAGDTVTFDGAAQAPAQVTLVVVVELGGAPFAAIKALRLGAAAANPTIAEVRADGAVVEDAIAVPVGDVELAIDAADDDRVDWLTSIGELSDPDDAATTLTTEEAGAGQLVVVRRDDAGGVAWRVLAVTAE